MVERTFHLSDKATREFDTIAALYQLDDDKAFDRILITITRLMEHVVNGGKVNMTDSSGTSYQVQMIDELNLAIKPSALTVRKKIRLFFWIQILRFLSLFFIPKNPQKREFLFPTSKLYFVSCLGTT